MENDPAASGIATGLTVIQRLDDHLAGAVDAVLDDARRVAQLPGLATERQRLHAAGGLARFGERDPYRDLLFRLQAEICRDPGAKPQWSANAAP